MCLRNVALGCFELETKAADGQLAQLRLVKSLMYHVECMADLGQTELDVLEI